MSLLFNRDYPEPFSQVEVAKRMAILENVRVLQDVVGDAELRDAAARYLREVVEDSFVQLSLRTAFLGKDLEPLIPTATPVRPTHELDLDWAEAQVSQDPLLQAADETFDTNTYALEALKRRLEDRYGERGIPCVEDLCHEVEQQSARLKDGVNRLIMSYEQFQSTISRSAEILEAFEVLRGELAIAELMLSSGETIQVQSEEAELQELVSSVTDTYLREMFEIEILSERLFSMAIVDAGQLSSQPKSAFCKYPSVRKLLFQRVIDLIRARNNSL